MKKTLVALAALAATGAFAQVSITGEYAYGWNTSNTSAGVEASGFGVDTTFVKFAATEDLGGGLKAAAEMSLDGFARGAANGGDNSLTLSGGFGKIKLANDKGADYLSSVIGGVPGLDDKVYGKRTINDSVAYTSSSFGGLTFGISHTEAAAGAGIGAGAASNVDQRSNTMTLAYASGALSVNAGFTSYDNQDTAANKPNNGKTRTRVKGSYDLGVLTLGAGFVQKQQNNGTTTDAIVAVSVPMGALSLGVDIGNSKRADSGTAANDVTKSGYGLKAVYSLSKRTSLVGAYTNWDDAVGTQRASLTELVVSHTF